MTRVWPRRVELVELKAALGRARTQDRIFEDGVDEPTGVEPHAENGALSGKARER